MGWSSTKFHGKYAGMDSDNNITVTDIMRIVNIILSIKDSKLKIENWRLTIDFGCAGWKSFSAFGRLKIQNSKLISAALI